MRHLGLRAKLLLGSAGVVLLAVGASLLSAAWYVREQQLEAHLSRTRAIAGALSVELERILATSVRLTDLQGFDRACDDVLRRHPDLAYAAIVGADHRVLFRSQRQATPPPPLPAWQAQADGSPAPRVTTDDAELSLAPVRGADGSVVATTVVALPLDVVQAEFRALLVRAGAAGGVVLVLVLVLLDQALSRLLLRPLRSLVRAVERMRAGDLQARVSPGAERTDELGVLARGFNGLAQGVAERERELVGARDTAVQAGQAQARFLARMTHELRTPLNAMLGMSELLARSQLDARQRQWVEQVRGAGRMLSDIVSELLDLSRIEAGRLKIVRATFVLREIIDETVAPHAELAAQRGLAFQLHVDAALPERVIGDALRLRQVLGNVLDNAIKFTERGSVRVAVMPNGERIRFSVSDTGVGIADDFLAHVYEAFRQGDMSAARRHGGSGLGLTVAHRLCVAMGGAIDVQSRLGQGTTFWFDLPLPAAPADSLVSAGSAAPQPEEAPSSRPPPGSLNGLRVLLVEDDVIGRELVRQSLAETGCHLTMAHDGAQGLLRLGERAHDVVLLDWHLPGLDGLSLLAILRSYEERLGWPRTPVIVVTASDTPTDRETCLAAGVDDYLAKPFRPDELVTRVRRAVAQRERKPDPMGQRSPGP